MYTNIEYLKKHAGVIETAKALGYSTVGYQLGKYMRDREQKEEFLNNILNQINAQTKHASLQEDTMVKKAGVVSTIRNLGYGTVGYYLGKKVQDNDQKEALIENLKRQIEAQNKYASLNINQHNNTNSIVKKAMMEKQAVNFGNLFSAFKLFNKSNKLNPLMNKGFSINSKGQLSKPGIFSNIINRFTKSNGNQTITQVKPTITPEKAIGAQSLVKNRAPWIKGPSTTRTAVDPQKPFTSAPTTPTPEKSNFNIPSWTNSRYEQFRSQQNITPQNIVSKPRHFKNVMPLNRNTILGRQPVKPSTAPSVQPNTTPSVQPNTTLSVQPNTTPTVKPRNTTRKVDATNLTSGKLGNGSYTLENAHGSINSVNQINKDDIIWNNLYGNASPNAVMQKSLATAQKARRKQELLEVLQKQGPSYSSNSFDGFDTTRYKNTSQYRKPIPKVFNIQGEDASEVSKLLKEKGVNDVIINNLDDRATKITQNSRSLGNNFIAAGSGQGGMYSSPAQGFNGLHLGVNPAPIQKPKKTTRTKPTTSTITPESSSATGKGNIYDEVVIVDKKKKVNDLNEPIQTPANKDLLRIKARRTPRNLNIGSANQSNINTATHNPNTNTSTNIGNNIGNNTISDTNISNTGITNLNNTNIVNTQNSSPGEQKAQGFFSKIKNFFGNRFNRVDTSTPFLKKKLQGKTPEKQTINFNNFTAANTSNATSDAFNTIYTPKETGYVSNAGHRAIAPYTVNAEKLITENAVGKGIENRNLTNPKYTTPARKKLEDVYSINNTAQKVTPDLDLRSQGYFKSKGRGKFIDDASNDLSKNNGGSLSIWDNVHTDITGTPYYKIPGVKDPSVYETGINNSAYKELQKSLPSTVTYDSTVKNTWGGKDRVAILKEKQEKARKALEEAANPKESWWSKLKNRIGSTKDKNTSLLQKKLKGITPEEAAEIENNAETSLSDTYNSMKKWVKENPGKTLMGAGALGGLGIASLNSGGADNYYNNVDRYYYNGFNPNYNQYNNQR